MSQTGKHYSFLKRMLVIAFWATVAAFISKIFLVQYYVVPTDSMYKTILIDDGIIVSKLHYGPNVFGKRLPGISSVKRSDIIVFNDPLHKGQFLIKRLIGLPGDTLRLTHQQVVIDSRHIDDPPKSTSIFFLQTRRRHELDYLIQNEQLQIINRTDSNAAFTSITTKTAKLLRYRKGILTLTPVEDTKADQNIYPSGSNFRWNRDNYGPVVIPKKGQKVFVTSSNYLLYKKIVEEETGKSLKLVNNKVLLDDMLLTTMNFGKNYYFMLGDNRGTSKDSRYFGFVAYDQIIGKALVKVTFKDKKWLEFTIL